MIKKLEIDITTPLETQLKKLGITNYLNLSQVTHLFPLVSEIKNVDDGKSMCNISPSKAQEQFAKENRRGLNIYEGLALFRASPNILHSHYLDLCGCRYESKDVPSLWLGGAGPGLGAFFSDYAGPRWGAPSCGSVKSGSLNLDPLDSFPLELVINGLKYKRVK